MKASMIALITAGTVFMGCSQKITPENLPSVVKNAVHSKFPAAQVVEWEKEGSLFEAEFAIGQTEYTALVDGTGNIVKSKQELTAADLPAEIAMTLKKDFQAYLVEDVERVEQQGQVYFQVELENNNEELKQVYTAAGTAASVPFWD
ncbi:MULTISPECIES: PepSY-like domain-containing protein [Rufibacter]|uniref:Beta-lactamase-inhibitor-like PepSY-like domain-containing protein n=1 Tax=Rufibacter quisquiliarum TaxID=1549639 RepID=A0A839GDN2_9BACT|nr:MULTISPECIES: PepSY-like domain-containing protein [Rufibacter]MBA9077022.1 hypothetical protein [Rufibacter quisquiliarum]